MASSSRGLEFVLTFGTVAWLATSVRTSSPGSGWWGTNEALTLRQAAKAAIAKGDFAETERVYARAERIASSRHDRLARAWCLSGIADARFASFDYRGALEAYLEAKSLAQRARDPVLLGAIDFNLSSLYQQLWDAESALRAAEEAQNVTRNLKNVYYRPQLLQQLGRLRADKTSIALFRKSIEAARDAPVDLGQRALIEAKSWDYLADALLDAGDVAGASDAEQHALTLRQGPARRDLGFSYWVLARLRLKQADRTAGTADRRRLLAEAEDFVNRAMLSRAVRNFRLQYERGLILLAEGRVRDAMLALEAAVVSAQRWRVGVAQSQTTVDGVATGLQEQIFDRFIGVAADYGIRNHDRRWIEESFEVEELNRAVNLRDASSMRSRELPIEYWNVLATLDSEEFKSSSKTTGGCTVCASLRLKLTEMEATLGLGDLPNIAENFPRHDSLIHFQDSLKGSEIFLSFSLGETGSFLWAVTRDTLHAYRLAPGGTIVDAVRRFREAVAAAKKREASRLSAGQTGNQGFEELGTQLYSNLFGQLDPKETARPAWLISASDALLELPFGALPLEFSKRSGQMVFLAERHFVEIRAGALLPSPLPPHPTGGFVSVGDPIYNTADPRWMAPWPFWMLRLPGLGSDGGGLLLSRLPGSSREAEESAAAWGDTSVVLEGASAQLGTFLRAIVPPPQVIHLATHALTGSSASGAGENAYLAFGLGAEGRPELLNTSKIRSLDVSGAVVVMTGCATAPASVRSGLGLAGLVRAWTVAGASAVVATEWPVEDSAGTALLVSFYKHLRAQPESGVARALNRAQIEIIRSGTTEAAPSVWAAYKVFAGQRGFAGRDVQ